MEIATHLAIDRRLCGEPIEIDARRAVVRLVTTPEMAADDRKLVHGGFLFGMADYAAMLAVNDPHVVLGSSSARFLKPVVVGDELLAEAVVDEIDGSKFFVGVTVLRDQQVVMSGEFVCYVLDRHVLDRQRPQRRSEAPSVVADPAPSDEEAK